MKTIFKKIIITLLTWEARLVLRKYQPTIVAVTGNVGKTSTKDALFAVLSRAYYVRKSEKSFNSDIGVPLTILGLPNAWRNPLKWIGNIFRGLGVLVLKNHYPKWLILEVGADRPGDIKRIARWLQPDIAVVTHIGEVPVHIEYFKSAREVAEEKRYLVSALKHSGLLVIGVDNPYFAFMKEENKARVVTFGEDDTADMYASHVDTVYADGKTPTGMTFKANFGSSSVPVRVHNTVGGHLVRPVLAAFAVAVSEHINLMSAVEWIGEFETPPGRMKIVSGKNNTTIIDDSYNASPVATHAALNTLKSVETSGRRIAVLADMLELGKHSSACHREIGEAVVGSVDLFFAVGVRMAEAAEVALEKGMAQKRVRTFSNAHEVATALEQEVKENDIVLVKGSQSMRMERVVERLMAHPERKKELLVRQDADWLVKP